jgi:hypothetical protein
VYYAIIKQQESKEAFAMSPAARDQVVVAHDSTPTHAPIHTAYNVPPFHHEKAAVDTCMEKELERVLAVVDDLARRVDVSERGREKVESELARVLGLVKGLVGKVEALDGDVGQLKSKLA